MYTCIKILGGISDRIHARKFRHSFNAFRCFFFTLYFTIKFVFTFTTRLFIFSEDAV